jgi:hypothetical protein
LGEVDSSTAAQGGVREVAIAFIHLLLMRESPLE